jgi:glycerol-3-phosphate dehydrogenase
VPLQQTISLSQGSHLILPKLYQGHQAYILQNLDQRIVFVIPYAEQWTLIGTTDTPYQGDPSQVKLTAEERDYLLASVSRYWQQPLSAAQVQASYSGVRPLAGNANELAKVSRDYRIEYHRQAALLVNILGGKLTTHRQLAKQVVKDLLPHFSLQKPIDAAYVIPGGDLGGQSFADFSREMQKRYAWLTADLCQRYCDQYGSHIERLLEGCRHFSDLGQDLGQGLYERECAYLKQHELALKLDDMLWRRTKLGLRAWRRRP